MKNLEAAQAARPRLIQGSVAGLLCTSMALVCFGLVGLQAAVAAIGFINPPLLSSEFTCTTAGCGIHPQIERLVPDHLKEAYRGSPRAEEAVRTHLAEVQPRLIYGTSVLLNVVPKLLFFLGLGKVFSIASAGGPFNTKLVGWIQVAALAALAGALLQPLVTFLRSLAILPALGRSNVTFLIEVYGFIENVLLAGAIFVAAWAINRGLELQEESESFL